jgi:hypothetical protein
MGSLILTACLGGTPCTDPLVDESPVDAPISLQAVNDTEPDDDPFDSVADEDDRDETQAGGPRGEIVTSLVAFQQSVHASDFRHGDYRRLNAAPPPLIYSLCVLRI